MREILFRGKRIDNGEWIEGYFVYCKSEYDYEKTAEIIPREADRIYRGEYDLYDVREVDPDTVGQYTGLTDCGNEKLFEHDVVTAKFKANGARYNFKIVFKNGYFLFDNGYVAVLFNEIRSVRKIGNIHDNPELLGEREDNG